MVRCWLARSSGWREEEDVDEERDGNEDNGDKRRQREASTATTGPQASLRWRLQAQKVSKKSTDNGTRCSHILVFSFIDDAQPSASPLASLRGEGAEVKPEMIAVAIYVGGKLHR